MHEGQMNSTLNFSHIFLCILEEITVMSGPNKTGWQAGFGPWAACKNFRVRSLFHIFLKLHKEFLLHSATSRF